MRSEFVLLLLGVIIASAASAQQQSVISAAGDVNHNGKISLEWTVGEMSVETLNTGKGIYTQGFHQPLHVKRTPQVVPSSSVLPDYLFTVAPNPVLSELTVSIDNEIKSKVQVQLTDLHGKTLAVFALSFSKTFKFSFQNRPSGTYFIIIRNERSELLKSFSVIK